MGAKKSFIFCMVFLLGIILAISLTSAYTRSNPALTDPSGAGGILGSGNVPTAQDFDQSMCQKGQDFILNIAPEGCSPKVVRSDLLEEEGAPVFCPITATKINPLISVDAIKWINVNSKDLSKHVSSVSFHPYRGALQGFSTGFRQQDLDQPALLNKVGYAVIHLKSNPKEGELPESIKGNLSATISYDVENAFGVGDAQIRVKNLEDSEWQDKFERYSFWDGRGVLKLDSINNGVASLGVFSGNTKVSGETEYQNRLQTVNLKEGQVSDKIYLPSFPMCSGGLKLRMDSLENPTQTARLNINGRELQVAQGGSFLRDQCDLISINKYGLKQSVRISCEEDRSSVPQQQSFLGGGDNEFELNIDPRVNLSIDGEVDTYTIGDKLYDFDDDGSDRTVFLGYIGQRDEDKTPFILPVVTTDKNREEFLESGVFSDESIVRSYGRHVSSNAYEKGGISFRRGFAWVQNHANAIGRGTEVSAPIFINETKKPRFFYEFLREELKSWAGFDAAKNNFLEALGYDAAKDIDPPFTKKGTEKHGNKILYTKKDVKFVSLAGGANMRLNDTIRRYYEKAVQDFDTLSSDFSNVQDDTDKKTYGKKAFAEKIKLAKKTNQRATVKSLCEDFKQNYAKEDISISGLGIDICYDDVALSNSEQDSESVYIDDQLRDISFRGVREPSSDEYGVVINVDNAGEYSGTKEVSARNRVYISDDEYIELETGSLSKESVTLTTFVNKSYLDADKAFASREDSVTIPLDGYKIIGKNQYRISVEKINLDRVAKVGIVTDIDHQSSTADFNFQVNVEKRDINLTPEKTKERISKLNDSIETWNDVSDTLGKTVSGLKKACLATGSILNAKNFLQNAFGKGTGGLARQKVMRGDDGWQEKCTTLVNQGKYEDRRKCYLDNSDKIDQEVKEMRKLINKQNKDIKSIQDKYVEGSSGPLFGDDFVNTGKFKEEFSNKVAEKLDRSLVEKANQQRSNNEDELRYSLLQDIFSEGHDRNVYTVEKLRKVDLYIRNSKQNPNEKNLKRLYNNLLDVQKNSKNFEEQEKALDKAGVDIPSSEISILPKEDTNELPYYGKVASNFDVLRSNQIGGEKPIATVQSGTGENRGVYLVALDDSAGTGILPIAEKPEGTGNLQVYDIDGSRLDSSEIPEELKGVQFREYEEGTYKNNYIGSSSSDKGPVVRYYESSTFEGLPAVVPVDKPNGWYAAVKRELPSSAGESTRKYDRSGRINSFQLCNVGKDGIEEAFISGNDDICQGVNLRASGTYRNFHGLSTDEVRGLVDRARVAIEVASRSYSESGPVIIPNGKGEGVSWEVSRGEPYVGSSGMACEDFMSPEECNLIFNTCDPVVCPRSRCDFGGKFPVKDVQQSGLIGSTLLCSKNFPEVKIPICLTGVKASMDNIISIQESYRECLKTSLEEGKTVGICDQTQSVYMCDFAWRQAEPLVREGATQVAESVEGENTQGGGEYRNVQNAVSNAEQSVQYFTQEYGFNSNNAFNSRSVENIGTKVCEGFLSTPSASIGTAFEQITEPDSPAQFSGSFEEIPYSTVTNPPTSQYKVSYHIFAGKERGAYYKVFLRQGASGDYYNDVRGTRQVAADYLEQGEKATESKDFRAPSGYGELCINVNGRLECGFKSASTSFAQNWMQDKYVQEQANNSNIRSREECISGSPSLQNALNPNLQQGAENALGPQIYKSGLTRVCANENPGKQSNNERWVDVGHCGSADMRCWLDKSSIKDSIDKEAIQNETLESANKKWKDQVKDNEKFISDREEFRKQFETIMNNTDDLKKRVNQLSAILDKVVFNDLKAKVIFQRGQDYAKLATDMFEDWAKQLREQEDEEEDDEEEDEGDGDDGRDSNQCVSDELIFRDGTTGSNLCYKYLNNQWHWGFSCEVNYWVPVEESLDNVKKGIVEKFYSNSIEEAFEIEPENVIEEGDLEDLGKNTGSGVEGEHHEAASTFFSQYISSRDREFIESLRGQNYETGFKSLLDRVLQSQEGGYFSDPTIKSYKDEVIFDISGRFSGGAISNGIVGSISFGTLEELDVRRPRPYLSYNYDRENNQWDIVLAREVSQGDGSFRAEKKPYSSVGDLSSEDPERIRSFVREELEFLEGKNFVEGSTAILAGGEDIPNCFSEGLSSKTEGSSCNAFGTTRCSEDNSKILRCEGEGNNMNWVEEESCSPGKCDSRDVSCSQDITPSVEEWSYQKALEYINSERVSPDDPYSEHKDFVDALYEQGYLEEEQYVEITGTSGPTPSIGGKLANLFNTQEDMSYVEEVLIENQANNPDSQEDDFQQTSQVEVQGVDRKFIEMRFLLLRSKENKVGDVQGLKCFLEDSSDADNYASSLIKAGNEYDIDPVFLLAIMIQESGCKPGADSSEDSSEGAKGLMQLELGADSAANELCVGDDSIASTLSELIGGNVDEFSQNNILCGAKILKEKYGQYEGGVEESTPYKNNDDFRKNKVNPCIDSYGKYSEYRGWSAALRGYNGWGCGSGADVDYVEKVVSKYEDLKNILSASSAFSGGAPSQTQQDSQDQQDSPDQQSSVKRYSLKSSLNSKQEDDLSSNMESFLTCVSSEYYNSTGEDLTVTSITDNGLYAGDCDLTDPDENFQNPSHCVHKRGSCHYAGSQVGEVLSNAVDIRDRNWNGANGKRAEFNKAFDQCSGDYSGLGNFDVVNESDHTHIELENRCGEAVVDPQPVS